VVPLFKMIKKPHSALSKINMAQYVEFKQMHDQLDHIFKHYFNKMKRARYLETLALMFNITLPSLTTFSVTKKWSRLGHFPLSLERTLLLCKEIIPNDTVDKVKANLRTWVDECVKTGTLSDKSMSAALGSIGGESLDDVHLRHQRVVILTHPQTVKSFTERRDKPLRDAEEAAKRKKEELAKKEQARMEMEQMKEPWLLQSATSVALHMSLQRARGLPRMVSSKATFCSTHVHLFNM
jgi:hypothetical protein